MGLETAESKAMNGLDVCVLVTCEHSEASRKRSCSSVRGATTTTTAGSRSGSMWTNSVSETSSVVGLGSVWANSKGKTVSVAGMDSVLGTGSVDAGSPAGTVEADSGSVGAD